MRVVEVSSGASVDDEPLLRDNELLAFVDQVEAGSPELLDVQELMDAPLNPWTSPAEDSTSASSPSAATSGLVGGSDGSPQSFATLPPWLVPDRVALRTCVERMLSEAESSDECGAASTDSLKRAALATIAHSADAEHRAPSNMATCARPEVSRTPARAAPVSDGSLAGLKEVERSRRRRQRRKDEVAGLHERIQELETELERLRRRGLVAAEEAMDRAIVFNLVAMPRLLNGGKTEDNGDDIGSEMKAPQSTRKLWKQIAQHHKQELRSSRAKNVRLRALAEQQLRVLQQLEVAFRSARRPTRSRQVSLTERAVHRGLFDSEAAVFESLRVHLSAQYMETDRVYKSSGLAAFDGDMVQAGAPRVVGTGGPTASQVYLENMECKVFPFSVQAVDDAVWHCLTNSDAAFHPGFYQVFEASQDIVTVKISDFVRLPQAETLVTVWVTVRRYREGERVVTVWNAMVETQGSLCMKLHERGWNVLRPLLPTTSRRNPAMCITQTVMRVSPVTSARFAVQDVAVGTLANVLIGCYHRTVVVMHHVLEKLLLTEFKTLTCDDR